MSSWTEGLETLPSYMIDGLMLYYTNGISPGSFLYAVLCNDLKGAFGAADETNRAHMFEWASFMYNHMPAQAQGSPEKVKAWMAHGGLYGINAVTDRPQEPETERDEASF